MNRYLVIILAIICDGSWMGFCEETGQTTVRRNRQPNYSQINNYQHPNSTSSSSSSSSSSLIHQSSAPTLNQRIFERISEMKIIDGEQLKNIQNIEFALSKMESNNQEYLNEMKEELKEINRKMQNTDWHQQRSEASLEELKNEIISFRKNLEARDPRQVQQQVSSTLPNNENNIDWAARFDSLATFLASTRSAVQNIERNFESLSTNITRLLAVSREIQRRQHTFPTKQYLGNALHSARISSNPTFLGVGGGGVSSSHSQSYPISCANSNIEQNSNNIQKIEINSKRGPFYVLCDNEIEDGGWTVIQHRIDGTVNFNRNWLEYKNGFGNLAGEFFIGLDKLHDITSATLHELLIVLEDFDGAKKYAKYSSFAIGNEYEDYALNILGNYEGNAGDSLSFSASYKFSTFDNDNDGWIEGNCAQSHTGAWWYNACEMSNLNGQYLNGELTSDQTFLGVYWNDFRGPTYSLKTSKMMIRPIDRNSTPDNY